MCRVELNEETSELIERYKAEGHPLTWKEHEGDRMPRLFIGDLVRERVTKSAA